MANEQIPFVMAMATISGSPPFPILVLDDEAAISVAAVASLAARLGTGLTGAESIHGLLQDWSRNFEALSRVVTALDDAELGKYTRSAFAALEFFDLLAPIPVPRQIFEVQHAVTCRPVSSLAGPRAKVPMPPDSTHLTAGTSLAAVVGAPSYRATHDEAAQSVAGLMVATRYRDSAGGAVAPALLPTGPYFVPMQFCPPELTARIAFNGETGVDSVATSAAAISALQKVSRECHLFPGDLVLMPLGDQGNIALGDGDIVETAIAGLGQQTTNIMMESTHANSRD